MGAAGMGVVSRASRILGEAGMGEAGMGEAGNEGTLTPALNTLLSLASKSISRGSRMCSTLPP